jgi:hypothetical protein
MYVIRNKVTGQFWYSDKLQGAKTFRSLNAAKCALTCFVGDSYYIKNCKRLKIEPDKKQLEKYKIKRDEWEIIEVVLKVVDEEVARRIFLDVL